MLNSILCLLLRFTSLLWLRPWDLEPDPLGLNHVYAIAELGDLGPCFLVYEMAMTTVPAYTGCCKIK